MRRNAEVKLRAANGIAYHIYRSWRESTFFRGCRPRTPVVIESEDSEAIQPQVAKTSRCALQAFFGLHVDAESELRGFALVILVE